MRRTVNVRFLLILAIGGTLVGGSLFGLYRVQLLRVHEQLRRLADGAEAEGKFDAAGKYLERYLRYQPGDTDVLTRYALTLAERADGPKARSQALLVMDQALAAQPMRDDLRKRVAELALETGQIKAAAWHLERLRKANPNNGELEAMLGRCEAANQHYETAAAWFEKAILHAPAGVDAYVRLAALREDQLGQPQHAEEVLDALVAANPTSYQAYLARARFRHRRASGAASRAAAWEDVARARALAPGDSAVLRTEAELALAEGDAARACTAAEECLSREPQQADLYLLLAAAQQQARRRADAMASLRRGLSAVAGPPRDALRLELAHLLIEERQFDDARAALEPLRYGYVQSSLVDLLQGRILLHEGRYDQAVAMLRRARADLRAPRNVALADLLLGVAQEPKDYRHYLALAQRLWSDDGPSPEAETTLRQAVALGGDAPDAVAALVQYFVGTGQSARADAAIAEVRSRMTPAAMIAALPYCYEIAGHPQAAERLLDEALTAPSADGTIQRGAADYYLRGGNFAKAIPHLRRILDLHAEPTDVRWARRQLAIGLALSGEYPRLAEALALLKQNRDEAGDDTTEDQRAMAVVLAQQPSSRGNAIRLLAALAERKALTVTERLLLVQLYDADGQPRQAEQHLSSLLADPHGKTPETLAYAIRSLCRQGAASQARTYIAELKAQEPDRFRTVALEAAVCAAAQQPAQALALLTRFAERDDADLSQVAAVLEELGQFDAADAMFDRAVCAKPQSAALVARARFLGRRGRLTEALDLCEQAQSAALIEALAPAGVAIVRHGPAAAVHYRRALEWLTNAQAGAPTSVPLQLALADLHDVLGRYDGAIARYRAVLAQHPDNVTALNNLAWLRAWQDDGSAEALRLMNRAIQLAGPQAALLDSRAVAHLARGDAWSAIDDLENAIAQAPSPARCFHLARAYDLAGLTNKAGKAMGEARSLGLTLGQLHPLEQMRCAPALERFGLSLRAPSAELAP